MEYPSYFIQKGVNDCHYCGTQFIYQVMLVSALNTSNGLEGQHNSALICHPHYSVFYRKKVTMFKIEFFFTFMANSWTLSPTHTGWVWPSTRPGLKTNRYHHKYIGDITWICVDMGYLFKSST